MTTSRLLTTKLTPPTPRGAVTRSRIEARLDGVPAAGLAVVTGAPGSGKTSLLATWAAACPDPVAWVSLDVDDNDAAAFWQAVLMAVVQALGADGVDEPTPPVGISAASDQVLRVVVDGIGDRRVWLVLDDLHHLRDRALLEEIGYLVRHQPEGMRLVVASRVDPPIGIAALRVQDRVVEITDADLAFTRAETEAALAEQGVHLDHGAVSTLVDRTDGWAAGIQLALHAMAGLDHPDEFVARFDGTQRTVAEFLVEEGLDRQPDDVRAFLLEVSVLEELTAPLCDAVRGRTDSARLLREVERRHLFAQRVDTHDGAVWYRLHDLFRDALTAELTTDDPTAPARLRRRAADWLDAHGRPIEAIAQYLAAGATDDAARAIMRVETDLLLRGWADTLSGWYAQLPPSVQPDELRLLRLFWTAAFVDNLARAELTLARIRELPETTAVDLTTEVTLAEAFLAFRRGDMTTTVQLADDVAKRYLDADERDAPGFTLAVVLAADARMHLGASAEAEAQIRTLLADPARHDDITGLEARAVLAAALAKQGRASEALAVAGEALGTLDPSVPRPRTLPEAWLAVAGAHLAKGRVDLVERDLERVRADAAAFRAGPVFAVIADEVAAHARWQAGDPDGALAVLAAALVWADDHGVGHDITRRIAAQRDRWQERIRQRSGVAELTAREYEVLTALASYRSLQEIADDLYVSLNTVKSHVKGIYAKLGVTSRNDAIRKAIDLGLLAPTEITPHG